MQLIEIKNLCAGYNGYQVLKNFSMSIDTGEFISLLGPNGAGKTTLFRALMGLLPIQSGTREVGGIPNATPQQLAHFVGYVPQKLNVDKTIPVTVQEFLRLKRNDILTEPERKEIFEALGLNALLSRCLGTLSTGEQQRIFLGYALLSKPKLILLDESLEGIDIGIQSNVYRYLQKLVAEKRASVVLISHDVSAVSQWASRVVCFGQGHLFDGDPKSPDFHSCLHKIYGETSIIHDHVH